MENQEHNMSIKEEHGEGSAYLPQLQAELDSIDVSFTSAKSLLEAGKVFATVESLKARSSWLILVLHMIVKVLLIHNLSQWPGVASIKYTILKRYES